MSLSVKPIKFPGGSWKSIMVIYCTQVILCGEDLISIPISTHCLFETVSAFCSRKTQNSNNCQVIALELTHNTQSTNQQINKKRLLWT